MITAVFIITIFNTGLIFLIGVGGYGALKDLIIQSAKGIKKHVDEDVNTLGTAIFNMDSLKQKATMHGKVDVD